MCATFEPPPLERLRALGIAVEDHAGKAQVFPQQLAPMVTSLDPHRAQWACFGLVPHWAEPKLARMTYNARTETVATKPSFRNAWRQGQLAAIPMQAFYEPCYETGKAVRHRIARRDGEIFWAAGLWERRLDDPGITKWSFTLLTINASEHPLMRRMHGPEDEKRSIVILPEEDRLAWLNAKAPEDRKAFWELFEAEVFSDVPYPPIRAKE